MQRCPALRCSVRERAGALVEQHVGGLYVAVEDAPRLEVRQRTRHLPQASGYTRARVRACVYVRECVSE